MEILHEKSDLHRAQRRFRESFHCMPHEVRHTAIGYQGGNFDADVVWVPSLDIWGYFGLPPNEKSPGERFWNPFGIGEPTSQVDIVCEVNPPRRGVNPATGGVFLLNAAGQMVVAHRCRFTVTGGISAEYFLQHYHGERLKVQAGGRETTLARVATLGSPAFPREIA